MLCFKLHPKSCLARQPIPCQNKYLARSVSTLISCPCSPLLHKVLSLFLAYGFDGSEKGQMTSAKTLQFKDKGNTMRFPHSWDILCIRVPISINHTIAPSLNVRRVVPKPSSARHPCQLFHCLPRRPTCLLPFTCLLVNVCIFFHLIKPIFIKQEHFHYFSKADWGHNSFCLSLLENPFRIYTYPFNLERENPILYLSQFIEIHLSQRIF